jgi:hypothetical protein
MKEFAVHMQCYKNEYAVEKCIEAFRNWYPENKFRLVSDNGSDFTDLATKHNLVFEKKAENITPGGKFGSSSSIMKYLERIYETCKLFDSEWIILFEDDVLTKGRIISFPSTDAAGVSSHPYKPELSALLNNSPSPFKGYGMAGGSIFRREIFIKCYENIDSFHLDDYAKLDPRIIGWGDLPLTFIFQINGYTYSEWSGVDEHASGIYRIGAAFEHNFKTYYGKS